MTKETTHSKEDILAWMDVLEAYGHDWDETFDRRASYFRQDFWYLLVNCMIANWKGAPLSVSGACQQMRSGSNRTREDRIRKAVADGFLIKRQSDSDRRETIVVPSEMLEKLMVGHFERTLNITTDLLRDLASK